jgi:hypothetical protein
MSAPRARRAHVPVVEDLEGRRLPSAYYASSSSYAVNLVRHEYHVFIGDLQRLELKSKATTAEALALRDDARAIAQDASTSGLNLQAAQTKALAVSLQLDRAPLDGGVSDQGWSVIAGRLAGNLSGLNVPQALVDRTTADMRAIADSAGVTAAATQRLDAEMQTLLDGEQWLGRNGYGAYRFPNPQLDYTQHLREFFRGAPGQKLAAEAKLNADLRQSETAAGDRPADAVVLHRDAILLEAVGATLTSDAGARFNGAYLAAFAQGAPSATALAQWPAQLRAALGPAATTATLANTDRLATDAPTFFRAVGSSVGNADRIVTDVEVLVAAGGGEPLDPFKVQLSRVVGR